MKNTVTSMQILKEFCEKIFVEHDAKGGCELLTEDVIWYYGSGDNMRSRAEALKFTENEICTMPAPYSIKYVGGESRKISDDTDEVFVRMKVSCLGNYRNINFFATVVNNSGGIFISSIHTAVEVVAEKGDNHTLPKMKFQNIINSIPGGIAIYKVSSVFETVFFSDGVPALTGYSVEEYRELIKCDAAEMTYYEDTEMVKEKIRYALENNTIADFTFRKSHRNGNIVWVRVQGVK
ncbi:MAG: PAS domain-containing protein, partial [Oscillospiraceae bacterium]